MNISYVAIFQHNMDNFTSLHYTGKEAPKQPHLFKSSCKPSKRNERNSFQTKAPDKFQNLEQTLQLQNWYVY